jgi:hypothetical protein
MPSVRFNQDLLTAAERKRRAVIGRLSARVAAIPTPSSRYIYGGAALLVLAMLYPIIDSAITGDDTARYLYLGPEEALHKSFFGVLSWQSSSLIQVGRFMPITAVTGVIGDYLDGDRLLYKTILVLLTFAAVVLLWRFLKALGFRSKWTPAIIAVAFALSTQLRLTFDPIQAEAGQQQVGLIFLLAGLLAYVRWLHGADRRWYWLSIVLAAACALTYEGDVPLLLAFACLHIGPDPERVRTRRSLLPFLAILIVDTLIIVYVHETASAPPAGYSPALGLFDVVQSVMRQSVAGVPGIYFASGGAGNYAGVTGNIFDAPTKAELLAAIWRAALIGLMFLAALRLTRRETVETGSGETEARPSSGHTVPLAATVAIGLVLTVCPTLFVAIAQKDQDSSFIPLGGGYLASLACTFGFMTLAVAGWEAWGRRLSGSRWLPVVGCSVLVLGFINAYANERIVALQWPGEKQSDILTSGVEAGALDSVSTGTTVFVDSRDLAGGIQDSFSTPTALDYYVYMTLHRKYDIQVGTAAPPSPCAGAPRTFPIEACAATSKRVAAFVPRATKGGGAVIVANGIPAQGLATTAPRTITVTATGDAASGPVPALSGTTAAGQPWAASSVHWMRRVLSNGWVQYFAHIKPANGPLTWSLNIAGAPYGLSTTPLTAGQTVRMFGTKHLLP